MNRSYYHTACLYCMEVVVNLQRCCRCKLAGYCKKEHQEQDFPVHKKFCKYISQYLENYEKVTFHMVVKMKLALANKLEVKLGRTLRRYEMEMCMFPPECSVCNKRNKLFHCTSCYCVSYCSLRHKTAHDATHNKYCLELLAMLRLDQYIFYYGIPEVKFNPFNLNHQQFPDNSLDVPKFLELTSPLPNDRSYMGLDHIFLARDMLKHASIGFGLSIISAIKQSGIQTRRCVLHVVDVGEEERKSNWVVITNMIIFWCQVDYITYHMIGSQVDELNFIDRTDALFSIRCHNGTYDEVYDGIESPDMVVVFNMRFNTDDSDAGASQPKLSNLLKLEYVPLLVTSYTKHEIQEYFCEIEKLNLEIQIICDVTENPYVIRVPHRNWDSKYCAIYYLNHFWFIISKMTD